MAINRVSKFICNRVHINRVPILFAIGYLFNCNRVTYCYLIYFFIDVFNIPIDNIIIIQVNVDFHIQTELLLIIIQNLLIILLYNAVII